MTLGSIHSKQRQREHWGGFGWLRTMGTCGWVPFLWYKAASSGVENGHRIAEPHWAVRKVCLLHSLSSASPFPLTLDSSPCGIIRESLSWQHPRKKLELNILPREEWSFSKICIIWQPWRITLSNWEKIEKPKIRKRVTWFPNVHSFHLIDVY